MTVYELLCLRMEYAETERMYGTGIWSRICGLLSRFWKLRINNLAVGEAGKPARVPERRKIWEEGRRKRR